MHEPIDEPEEERVYEVSDFKEQYPFAYRIEVQIAEAFTSEEQIKMADILMLIRNLMARSRAVLTFDELHAWMHKLLQDSEALLQTGQAFVDRDGNEVNMILAEERKALGDEVTSLEVPDTVPEDWE